MRALLAAVLLTMITAAPAGFAMAQGATSGAPAQSRLDDKGQSVTSAPSQAQVASVGAGTTSASTTGSSGPKKEKSKEVSVPPLPSAEQCATYKDTPAYRSCLSVVVREK